MSQLRIKELTSVDEFSKLGDSWQALAAQDDQAGLFNDWAWNSLWWEHYGHLGELLVLLVYEGEQLVGIGPFYRGQRRALGLKMCDTLQFIGTGGDTSPDDLNILVLASKRQTVTDVICDHVFSDKFPMRLLLTDVNAESSFYEAFTARNGCVNGYHVKQTIQSRRWATLPELWPDFRAQISRNTHKQIKRRQNRLDALENVNMQVCATQQDVDIAFTALIDLHSARWQSKGGAGSFGSEVYRSFHQSLMKQLLVRKQLWLITLTLDDEIIAVEYAFSYKDTLMFFQTGFNPAHENLSPGHVLMTFAIKQSIESGLKRIDLLKGDYEYKSSYTNEERLSASLGFYRTGLFSLLARLNDVRLRMRR